MMAGLRIVPCSGIALAQILKGSDRPYTSNLPRDLEVVGVLRMDPSRVNDTIDLVCRSSEWGQAPEGPPIPQVAVTFYTERLPSIDGADDWHVQSSDDRKVPERPKPPPPVDATDGRIPKRP